ncbi:Non-repetitive/WGA-negative nucleoporin C-terminal-domain-containing protein [Lenzites betulinus]|nr:Non-repetitive/WGA-negative nucleoporin C-terminal-domain-containing protein [Lenzites betulinus]
MATFSPQPRRTARYSSIGMSPSPPRQGPARRTRAGSTQPQSRFSTPARGGAKLGTVRDDESIMSGSGMDVDDNSSEVFERGLRADAVFSKSKEMTVMFYAQLPVEVKQALRSADFYRDAYTGDVDTLTGFAVVASLRTCFVWKYSQALTGTPTCYIFGCPKEPYPPPMATPFHALVPFGAQREPGLIVCSNIGQIRFWDSIGMGLAGGDNFSFSLLELVEGENVTNLVRADSQTFIASTTAGRLFRLVVTSSGGKYHLSFHTFGRPQSSLSRLLPSFWSGPELQPQPGFISAVAAEELARGATGRLVWALVDLRLQQWNMSIEGWETLEAEEDIGEQTRTAVREHFPGAPESDVELDLELLDLKLQGSDDMVILVSWAGQDEESTSTDFATHPRRVYAVVYLRHLPGAFTVTKVQTVPYQSTSSSGAPMHPRLQVIVPQKLIAIQFGDAVTICAQENEYMDRLELKSAMDRTLGVGVVQGESEFLVLTAATMMKTAIDLDEVAKFHPETGRANLIKSTMTKAILYGSVSENPLHFSFPPEVDEEALMSGAEQLSDAILESDTEVVRAHHDLHTQMSGRKDRLSFLIKFINDNSALTKMSQRSRQTLAADAEKLYSADQLWLRHNDSLRSGNTDDVLHEAVYRYMNALGEGHHEDCLRAFLRLRVRDLGGLLPQAVELVRRSSSQMGGKSTETIPQANQIVLTILQSAHSYREYNKGVYGIVLPMLDPWTSRPEVIDIVNELFNLTAQLVEAPSGDSHAADTKKVPRQQLPELAACLFRCIQERLDWLGSPTAAEDSGTERDRSQLEDRFRQLRPEVLEVLRRNGFANEAFKLAEDYHDFRSLASLCHKGKVYPPEENPNAARIEAYVEKFREAFTTELYQWYIEHGELRTMFAQDHQEYLDAFFAEHPHPGISWIHDLGRSRYAQASQALLTEAEHAPELVSKHLMLSMGKLSHLAQLHDGTRAINQDVIDAFHDGLDFVSVHDTLIEDLKSALASVRTRQSLEMQVETITLKKAGNLSNRRALYNVFKFLVRQLLQGKALSVEDMAEILSLKDNYGKVEDYVTSLHLLARAENIPSSRRLSVFKNVWRRIYIHDDWNLIRQTTGVSDEELNQRLRSTALYAALQAVAHKRARPEGYRLTPTEALDVPAEDELALRWPSMSPEEAAAIARDYERDSRALRDLDLEGIYLSLEELVNADEGLPRGS